MMKWDKPNGGVQHTLDKRYSIVRATHEPEIWIAYAISPFQSTGKKLPPEQSCAEDAREVCEEYELALVTARQIA